MTTGAMRKKLIILALAVGKTAFAHNIAQNMEPSWLRLLAHFLSGNGRAGLWLQKGWLILTLFIAGNWQMKSGKNIPLQLIWPMLSIDTPGIRLQRFVANSWPGNGSLGLVWLIFAADYGNWAWSRQQKFRKFPGSWRSWLRSSGAGHLASQLSRGVGATG